MSDIVDRLRAADTGWSGDAVCVGAEVAAEGANEIERLRKEVARLRAALQRIVDNRDNKNWRKHEIVQEAERALKAAVDPQ